MLEQNITQNIPLVLIGASCMLFTIHLCYLDTAAVSEQIQEQLLNWKQWGSEVKSFSVLIPLVQSRGSARANTCTALQHSRTGGMHRDRMRICA